MTSPSFPAPPPSIPATPLAVIDELVTKLAAKKDVWAKTSIAERLKLLEQLKNGIMKEAPSWAAALSKLKGIEAGSSLSGEDWLAGPVTTVRNVRLLMTALEQNGQPKPPALSQRKDGTWVAQVLPSNTLEKLQYTGWKAEVWMEPGQSPSQGRIYREKQEKGKVALVLAAGNVSSIGPMDVLYKLFVENEVVIMKMNPVNETGGPFIERAFKPLIDAGFLAVVYGAGDVGKHLTDHPLVDTIHITGSDRTHDVIIWGSTAEEQAKNKAAKTPRLVKPISSELGCVTPVLVMPGAWSDDDVAFQAEHVAGMVAQNGSFNCNAAKVVVTWKGWPLRAKFMGLLEEHLRKTPARKAYYPGAEQRYKNFVDKYPNHKVIGPTGPDIVPWTLLPEVTPKKGEYALTNEAFCGVLADVALEAKDEADYFDAALKFANDDCWGTLSCMVLIHPDSMKKHAEKFDQLIAGLRYGGIAVNCWAGAIYGSCAATWGAFPGHPLDEIVSGRGVVHNTFLFDHPQKTVMTLPWRIKPTPVWFPNHKNLAQLAERLAGIEADPSFLKLPGLVTAALKG
ncbi:MAG: aldehyde dehydrogenase family protein [Deltaproteobacteria bacterium]|nr:aldehyde dehydrogenase family protein [Deltaproteobacteria bacterium]